MAFRTRLMMHVYSKYMSKDVCVFGPSPLAPRPSPLAREATQRALVPGARALAL